MTPGSADRGGLRRRARRIRDAVPPAERARLSAQVSARALRLLAGTGADTVVMFMFFMSF